MGWREIDSTADKAIQVTSRTLEGLFTFAAHGMTSISYERYTPIGVRIFSREICLDAFDEESLLIDWLNEILAFIDERPSRGAVHSVQITDFSGITADVERPYVKSVVALADCFAPSGARLKAATYHDIKIEKVDGWYTATITFDV